MDRNKQPGKDKPCIPGYKKLLALLVAAFTLYNFIVVFPAAASTAQQIPSMSPAQSSFCIPIPIIHPCSTPTPPPCVPVPIIHPCNTPTPTSVPTGTPQPTPAGTPSPTPEGTGTPTAPTPTPTVPQLSASGSFTLTATKIVGTNAHLDETDLLHPVLTFSAVTIQGMKLTSLSLSLSAAGSVSGTGVSIKTSVFHELTTALGSFTNKADLLLLLAGQTVKTLTMTNVTLQVDRYIEMQTLTVNGLTVG